MTEQRTYTAVREEPRAPGRAADEHAAALAWLQSEFPEWIFEVGTSRTMSRGDQPWWVAKREGHHPQSELTPGKLYSRLTDYLVRERRRSAHLN